MTRFKYLGAAFALTLATTAFAAGDCCKDCCKDSQKAECCEKHDSTAPSHGDHADHADHADHGKADSQPK